MIISSRAIRRAFLAAAVVMLPLGVITLGPVPAGALTFPPTTCSLSGTLTFEGSAAGQGISKDGWTQASSLPADGAAISYTVGGCNGNTDSSFINVGVRCNPHKLGSQPASNPACERGQMWGFNSWANVLGTFPPAKVLKGGRGASYAVAIQHTFGGFASPWFFVINGTTFSAVSKTDVFVPAGGACGPSELGFQSTAHVEIPRHVSQPMIVTLCLGAITGTGLNPGDNFYNASVDQIGVVDTAAIDPATSTIQIG